MASATLEFRHIAIYPKMNKYGRIAYLFLAHEFLHIILVQGHEGAEQESLLNNGAVLLNKWVMGQEYQKQISERLPLHDQALVRQKHKVFFE